MFTSSVNRLGRTSEYYIEVEQKGGGGGAGPLCSPWLRPCLGANNKPIPMNEQKQNTIFKPRRFCPIYYCLLSGLQAFLETNIKTNTKLTHSTSKSKTEKLNY